ncbi:MAG: DUF4190 domain-containing protein [Chloroflexi bacterium]|nr:DUF4190 domain-containing protein [Chloroflexota bacterium]
MDQSSNAPMPAPAGDGNQRIMAIASLVIGILNLCAWFFPICGIPLGIIGVVLGVLGMKSVAQKNLAIAGIVLSAIGILLACANAIAGVFLGPQIQNIFDQINQSLAP